MSCIGNVSKLCVAPSTASEAVGHLPALPSVDGCACGLYTLFPTWLEVDRGPL